MPSTNIIQLLVISLSLTLTIAQVNQEIYSEEDLLAIDSESHNTVVIAPPPGFSSNSVEPVVDEKTSGPDGSHSFSYSLADGTKHSQSGYFSQNGYVLEGFWEYYGTDGNLYRTEFIADQDGYRPKIFKMERARKSRTLSLKKKSKYGRFNTKRKNRRLSNRN